MRDQLLLINVDGRARPLLLQTVWGDAQGGRRTHIEEPADLEALVRRLAELTAEIFEPIGLAAAA